MSNRAALAAAIAVAVLSGCAATATAEEAAIAHVQAEWVGGDVPSADAIRDAFTFACLFYAEGHDGRTGAADLSPEETANSDLIAEAALATC